MITLYTRNILETGTVSVTGTPDTGYPACRLYDRHTALFWKDTAAEAKTFQVDQGLSILAIDFLAIERHNFSGKTITWEWSTDNIAWNDAVTPWIQGNNEQIIKTIDEALTKQYWRITVSSIASPKCSEIFMSYGYEFDYIESSPYALGQQANVSWVESLGGLERSTKFGKERWVKSYAFYLTGTQRTSFEYAESDIDGESNPFYFKDDEDNYSLCRILSSPNKDFSIENYVTISISLIEEL